jgi:hypothetical protein
VASYFLDERRLRPGNAMAALITAEVRIIFYLFQLRKPEISIQAIGDCSVALLMPANRPSYRYSASFKEELGLTAGIISCFTEHAGHRTRYSDQHVRRRVRFPRVVASCCAADARA